MSDHPLWRYLVKQDMSTWEFLKWAMTPPPIDRSTLPRITSVSSTPMKFFEANCAMCDYPGDPKHSLNNDGPGPAFCSSGCLERAMSRYLQNRECGKEQDPAEWLDQWGEAQQKVHLSWLEMANRKLATEQAKRDAELDKQKQQLEAELKELEAQEVEFEKNKQIVDEATRDLKLRMEHTFVLGGAGAGKTTLLLLHNLASLTENKSARIILDPKGLVETKIGRLKVFKTLYRDKLIIINPLHFTPSCSPFFSRNKVDNEADRQKLENIKTDLLIYSFNSRENSLTPQQLTCLKHVLRLIFQMPDPTMDTLLNLLSKDVTPSIDSIRQYADKLPKTSRNFFYNSYFGATYKATREGISVRLHGLLSDPVLDKAFNAPTNKIDIASWIQEKKTVIISVPFGLMTEDAATTFARYSLATVLSAAVEQFMRYKDQSVPCELFVDEAQLVADDKIATILQIAREYRLGLSLFTPVGSLPNSILSPLSANTSQKYAANLSGDDLLWMSRAMECKPEFFHDAHPDGAEGKFAYFARGRMKRPIIMGGIPLDAIGNLPTMEEDEYQAIINQSKALVGISDSPRANPPPAPISEPDPVQSKPKPDPVIERPKGKKWGAKK